MPLVKSLLRVVRAHRDTLGHKAFVEAFAAIQFLPARDAAWLPAGTPSRDAMYAMKEGRLEALRLAARSGKGERRPALVSAVTGQGLEDLLARIEAMLAAGRPTLELTLDAADGQGLAWLHAHAEVLSRKTLPDGGSRLLARVAPERLEELRRRFPNAATPREIQARRRASLLP
jgi:hypothetical protein